LICLARGFLDTQTVVDSRLARRLYAPVLFNTLNTKFDVRTLQLGYQSVVKIPSNRPTLGFQKYVFQPMVKRSPTTLTLSSLTHDSKTPFAGLVEPLKVPHRQLQGDGALPIGDDPPTRPELDRPWGNSFRLIVKVSIGARHFHGAVTPTTFSRGSSTRLPQQLTTSQRAI